MTVTETHMEMLRSVQEAEARGDLAQAAHLATQAIAKRVQHPLFFRVRASWLAEQGRDGEALADVRHAISLAADHAQTLAACGEVLRRLSRIDEAIAVFRNCVAINPGYAPAYYNLGWILQIAGQLDESERQFRKAIDLEPTSHVACSALANLMAQRGRWDDARKYAEATLALVPETVGAHIVLIQAALAENDFPAAERNISAALEYPNVKPIERAALWRLRGDLHHAQARYDEAFADYERANAEKVAIYAPRYEARAMGDAITLARWVAQYAEATPAQAFQMNRAQPPGGGPTGHIFLVGFPRSGTTLLESILASHPDVSVLQEKNALGQASFGLVPHDKGFAPLLSMDVAETDLRRQKYWDVVQQHGVDPAGKVFVDKHPLNLFRLAAAARLFPSAKILFAVRDPRDVVLSCFRQEFVVNPAMFQMLRLESAAQFYASLAAAADAMQKKLGMPWHMQRNEDLIDDFDNQTRAICDFAGLAWHESLRDFAAHSQTRVIATPSAGQVARGLSDEGVGQWRNYKTNLAPVLPVLKKWVQKYDYTAA